ncbi:MAG: hypothetical protein KR126chlam4_01068 [Candidatus Anoxychlamydiales bacterium]|nr:hypothetical protein [Candidatus Anoxychlamydiales bacterium]
MASVSPPTETRISLPSDESKSLIKNNSPKTSILRKICAAVSTIFCCLLAGSGAIGVATTYDLNYPFVYGLLNASFWGCLTYCTCFYLEKYQCTQRDYEPLQA